MRCVIVIVPEHLIAVKAIPNDLVEYDTYAKKMTIIKVYQSGPWSDNDHETLAKLYDLMRFKEEVFRHDEFSFWKTLSQRMYRLGIGRDPESCKEQVRTTIHMEVCYTILKWSAVYEESCALVK